MAGTLLALFCISPAISALAPALVAMLAALLVFLAGMGLNLTGGATGGILLIGTAIPASALIASFLVRRAVSVGDVRVLSALEQLASVIAAALSIGHAVTLFAAAGFLSSHSDVRSLLELASVAANNILFTAGLSAFVIMLPAALFEFAAGWFAGAGEILLPVSRTAISQLLILLLACAGFDLMIDLLSRELAPLTLLRGLQI